VPGCLVRLGGDLTPGPRSCLAGLGWASSRGALAPDGHHLAEGDDTDGTLMLVDLGRATVTRHCPARTALFWTDNSQVLAATDDGKVIRCGLDGSTPAILPGLITRAQQGGWAPVPRLGV
jgi:hypothetical protein